MAEITRSVSQRNILNKASKKAKVKKGGSLLTVFFVFFFLIVLFLGIYAGIYFKMIDLPQLTDKLQLYDYPLIGQYFPQPKTNFKTVDLPPAQLPVPQLAGAVAAVPKAATAEDTAKLIAAAKLAQEKRISKLASLYDAMNPDEAVPILNQLDDPTVLAIFSKMDEDQVSNIMAQLDPKRAAQLTQDMLKEEKPQHF